MAGTIVALIVLTAVANAADPATLNSFKDCETCPEMIVVPSGKAILGGEPWDQDMKASWGPTREVEIRYRLAMAKTEVTRAQYRRFVAETGYVSATTSCNTWGYNRILGQTEGYTWDDPGYAQREDHPVVCVSWQDATAFVAWLAAKTGKPYRLPSSTEFEYTARAGTRGPWFWGPDGTKACDYANVADDNWRRLYSFGPPFACNDQWERTSPVGSYKPNPWGLHDMLGNAWEWTEDCFHETFKGVPTDGSAWREAGGGDCTARTPRGASWASGTDWMKAVSQSRDPEAYHSQLLGFRVALTVGQ
jgi:formylglycine-generating enzyme required for sulfatase activity